MATRSKKIRNRIRLIVGNTGAVPNPLIYDRMSAVQRRLAEESLCLERSEDVSIVASTADYDEPSGYYKLKQINLPSGSTIEPVEVDQATFNNLSRVGVATTAVQYFSRWNGQIHFWPTPGSAATWTFFYYALPVYDLGRSNDPETPSYMDDAIEYGALAELLPLAGKFDLAQFYAAKYAMEQQRVKDSWRTTKNNIHEIDYHDV